MPKRIKFDGVPIMLHDEIQGASITGCLNPSILGGPCQKVALVFPYIYSSHKINKKHAVMVLGLIGVSMNKIKFAPMKVEANKIDKLDL